MNAIARAPPRDQSEDQIRKIIGRIEHIHTFRKSKLASAISRLANKSQQLLHSEEYGDDQGRPSDMTHEVLCKYFYC